MPPSKKKKHVPPSLLEHLSELEKRAVQKGIHIHYDILEAAGLKLKGGICKIEGEYHLFVDRRKTIDEKIDILLEHVDNPRLEEIPEGTVEGPTS